jgi:hypothetical protein
VGARAVRAWGERRLRAAEAHKLWMIKDAGANGGDGLFVASGATWARVCDRLDAAERAERRKIRFVVQEYVERPALWEGRFKYHIRMYVVLRADMGAFLHTRALAHVANKPYSASPEGFDDVQVHLTNVSKNHTNKELFHGCPILELESFLGARCWARLLALFAALFGAARPFMRHQVAAWDFAHIGVDIMLDAEGHPHLLECNVPPCIGNYNSEMVPEQHAFFNWLFTSMVDCFVVEPLTTRPAAPAAARSWCKVAEPRDDFAPAPPAQRGLNALAWKVYEAKTLAHAQPM